MKQEKQPYGYIYLTTNNINGKQYIGQHGGLFDPRYKGSGGALREDMKKFGNEHFIVKLICYANSFEELNELEHMYIEKYNAVDSEMFYNKANIVLNMDLRSNKMHEFLSSGIRHNKPNDFGDKMRKIRYKTLKRKGKSYWVTNGVEEHLVNPVEHETMYSDYVIGRLSDLVYMHKDDHTIKVHKEETEKYIQNGFTPGKSNKINKNISDARRKEIWSYNDNDFTSAKDLTDFLRKIGYSKIAVGTVVNLSKGVIVKAYPDLCGNIKRKPRCD